MRFIGLSRLPCFFLLRGIWLPEAKKLAGPTSRAEFISLLICTFRTGEIIPNSHQEVAINRHFSWNKRALSAWQPLVTHCSFVFLQLPARPFNLSRSETSAFPFTNSLLEWLQRSSALRNRLTVYVRAQINWFSEVRCTSEHFWK
jgi:hypothetical protein